MTTNEQLLYELSVAAEELYAVTHESFNPFRRGFSTWQYRAAKAEIRYAEAHDAVLERMCLRTE